MVSTDHPRSCGANFELVDVHFGCSGSSPLVRGQRRGRVRGPWFRRIIPARAGPTLNWLMFILVVPDHPRSCGANAEVECAGHGFDGSSPLVRGQHVCVMSHKVDGRIIPARAGPTLSDIIISSVKPDHPRSCGANSVAVADG